MRSRRIIFAVSGTRRRRRRAKTTLVGSNTIICRVLLLALLFYYCLCCCCCGPSSLTTAFTININIPPTTTSTSTTAATKNTLFSTTTTQRRVGQWSHRSCCPDVWGSDSRIPVARREPRQHPRQEPPARLLVVLHLSSDTASNENQETNSSGDDDDDDTHDTSSTSHFPSTRRREQMRRLSHKAYQTVKDSIIDPTITYFKHYVNEADDDEDDSPTSHSSSNRRREQIRRRSENAYKKVKDSIIYPTITYFKHYVNGERQEEFDGLGDVLVSDETPRNDDDDDERFDAAAAAAAEGLQAAATATVALDTEEVSSPPLDAGLTSAKTTTTATATTTTATDPAAAAETTTTNEQPQEVTTATTTDDDSIDFSDSFRSTTSAPHVDLSGHWEIVIDEKFKRDYDNYLKLLGQPFIVRSVALSIVQMTTEESRQSDEGRSLWIRGTNARGVWERTLQTSNENDELVMTPILTIDKEQVQAEAWWEENGAVHRSWLRGVTKYGGGNFESKRYLEKQQGNNNDDDSTHVFVCESTFHPDNPDQEAASITWRFRRQKN